MEFFRYLDSDRAADWLGRIDITNLPMYCASIDRVLSTQGDHGVIYCLWGEFEVRRELIHSGVRFTLPHCPNALTWTITAEDDAQGPTRITIHCTINRENHDEAFVESIHQFMDDWRWGLVAHRNVPLRLPSGGALSPAIEPGA